MHGDVKILKYGKYIAYFFSNFLAYDFGTVEFTEMLKIDKFYNDISHKMQ